MAEYPSNKCRVLKCSGCQFVYYCGKVCQIEGWNDHKWECANIKRVSPKEVPDGARILAKIINRLKRGDGASYKAYYSATSFRMWKDLMSHYSDIKTDKKRMDHFTSLCVVLFEFLKDLSLPNTVDLMGLYGRMVINSFTLLDMDMNSIGTGIYLAASIIDHSCEPNAVATFDGKTINIRAIKDMPTLDWRQIRITYIDLMKTPYERQMELQENYYFLCQCDRCMDETPLKYLHAAKCLNKLCDNPVQVLWKECILVKKQIENRNKVLENKETNGKASGVETDSNSNGFEGSLENIWDVCDKCDTKYIDEHKEAFVDAMKYSELHLQNMKGTEIAYVDVCKYCLERQEGVLHPLNIMHAQTLDHAFDALIQVQLWEQACVYAERLIPCFRCRVLKCSGCQFVYYCGKVCQIEGWNDHKWECANIKRVSPKEVPDGARILAKIINRLKRGDGASYKAYYSATSFRMWKDLMSHYSDIKTDKKRMDHFTSLCVVLFEFLKDLSLPNTVDLMGLYGRMVINSFTLLDMDMNSIGTGIYLAASIIDHSCEPNAVATFDGKTINIRAIKDMPTLDWRQIRITYIDLMKTPYERQMELQENYYFLCQCDRCMDETPLKYLHAAKCLNKLCDNPVQVLWKECILVKKQIENRNKVLENKETNGKASGVETDSNSNGFEGSLENIWDVCDKCDTKYIDEHKEAFVDAMKYSELHLQNMKGTEIAYVDVCKYCLERQEGVLHPLNIMHAQTLDHAFDALIQVQLWEQACVYAERLIPCFRFYYGNFHPLLGLLFMKYGKILLYKMDLRGALNQFQQAEKILKITHGERHTLYKDHLLPLLNQAIIETE